MQVRKVPAGLMEAVTRRRREAREVRQLPLQVAVRTAVIAKHDVKLDDIFALSREQLVAVRLGPGRRHDRHRNPPAGTGDCPGVTGHLGLSTRKAACKPRFPAERL